MPGLLVDTNVWLAAARSEHAANASARKILRTASVAEPAVFCRSTEQSFLRLLTTPTILKAYGVEGFTNRDALSALAAFQSLPQVDHREEPAGTGTLWHRLASRNTASPKVWMDAYLAAFTINAGLQFVTLDKDFRGYRSHGLNLVLLKP